MAPPPLIRISNDYAWTPVFPKAKVKIQKGNKTKPKKYNGFYFCTYSISMHELILYKKGRKRCLRFAKQNDIRHVRKEHGQFRASQLRVKFSIVRSDQT